MLSIYTLKSATEASRYYAKGDYYTTNAPEQSQWFGKGAERLNLKGPVDFQVFERLLSGYLPGGVVMTQTQKGEYHRPGYDLTFSAPKSVSILALVAGNEAVLAAHQEAVFDTLAHIEQQYAALRHKKQQVISFEKTQNLTFACFEEYESRAGDPQLHHHCVLMNATQRADQLWRTLYFDTVYDDKMILGLEYRARLSQKLMALGYVLAFKQGGLFEIKGVPEGLMETFSKRRAQIESWLDEHQVEGGKAAKVANFESRDAKKPEDLAVSKERWAQELKTLDLALETLTKLEKESKERGPVSLPDSAFFAAQALDLALEHGAQRNPQVSIRTLLKTTRRFALFPISEADCLGAIEAQIQNKTLFYVGEGRVKSQISMDQEQHILQSIQQAKAVEPLLTGWVADFILKWKVKDKAQKEALKFLLTTSKPQLLIESTSKILLRETFKQVNHLCEKQHFYPCFLSNKSSELSSLKEHLKTGRVFGIEGFLLRVESQIKQKNPNPSRLEQWTQNLKARQAREVWMVVSSMSLSQYSRLQAAAQALHARLILSQNAKSSCLEPFKAQGLSAYTLKAPTTVMQSLERRQALLTRLERLTRVGAIHECIDKTQSIQKGAELSVQPKSLKPILTLTHQDRMAVNEAVRHLLRERGTLGASSLEVAVLEPLGFTAAQKSQVASYQPGDVIRFLGPKQGRYFGGTYEVVKAVDLKSESLSFESGKIWSPSSHLSLKRLEVFKKVIRSIQVNESIQWTRTIRHVQDKRLDRVAYQKARVIQINENTQQVTVRLNHGQSLSFNPAALEHAHWDYGYATLLKQSDLEKPQSSIVLLNAEGIDGSAIESLAQCFEQGQALKKSMQIVCPDFKALKKAIIQATPASLKSLEALPYERSDALKQDQTIPTQMVFAGLQAEYLKVRELNPEFLGSTLKQETQTAIEVNLKQAARVVDFVCLYHAERDAVFSYKTVLKEAMECAEGTLNTSQLTKAFDLALSKGWLMKVGQNKQGEALLSCRHTVLLEKLCIHEMKQAQNQVAPLFEGDSSAIQTVRAHPQLTQGQKAAVELLLTTRDRFCAVQGIAGAGKTTALKMMKDCCATQGFTPLVLANTGNAKDQAMMASGLPAMTTAQFLTQVDTALKQDLEQAQKTYGHHRLLIVDEASQVATQELFYLQRLAQHLDLHLSFTGDFKQQGSLGAGVSFEDLLGYGLQKAVMKENVRLKSPKAFELLQKGYAGDVKGQLRILRDRIEEIPLKSEALGRMVELYMECLAQNEAPPLVITPLNVDRQIVNEGIRAQLKQKGYLKGEDFQTTVLLPVDKREVQKRSIQGFELGEVLRFNRAYPRLGIEAGSYWSVHTIDVEHHRLTLEAYGPSQIDPKRLLYWAPKDLEKASHLEVYKSAPRTLNEGDWIIFRRNQPSLGLCNGDKAQIVGFHEQHLQLRLSNQSILQVPLNTTSNRHFDYGYALTVYQAQGRDVPIVIAYGDTPAPIQRLASQLKVGDVITLPKTPDEQRGKTPSSEIRNRSILTRVIATDKNKLILVDNLGHRYIESFEPHQRFDYFLPIPLRPLKDLPKTTSQKAFLVQTSRGDVVYLIVPNVRDFQTLLELQWQDKRSALSYLDPQWATLNQAVQRLVKAIEWAHAPKAPVQDKRIRQHKALKMERHGVHGSRPKAWFDQAALADYLRNHVVEYATRWLGTPKIRSAQALRWSGGITVTIRGPKTGQWRYWKEDVGGKDLISLYAHVYQCSWKEALKELATNLGFEPSKETPSRRRSSMERTMKSDQVSSKSQQIKAQKLYAKAQSIQGTLAEKYLREVRGIQGDLPSKFRFVASTFHFETKQWVPALLAPVLNKEGQLQSLSRIFLNADGSKYNASYEDEAGRTQKANAKLTVGSLGHSGVVVQEGLDSRTVWIAEGIETALSIKEALPAQTVIATLSVSRLQKIRMNAGVEQVVICADRDGDQSPTYKAVIKAVEHYLDQGLKVFIAMPSGLESPKQDFNDVLKNRGVFEVQQCLTQKVEIKNLAFLSADPLVLPQTLEKLRQVNTPNRNQALTQTQHLERDR